MTTELEKAINERWPSDEQIALRKAALFERLSTFLEVRRGEDGGWALLEDQDVDDVREIFDEIIDLKVERDCDGDRTIQFYLADRRKGRLHPVYESNSSYSDKDESSMAEKLDKIRALAQQVDYAHAVANSMSTSLRGEIEHLQRIEEAKETRAAKLVALRKDIVDLGYDEARALILDNKSIVREMLDVDKSIQIGMAERFPGELNVEIDMAIKAMAAYESDDEDGFYKAVIERRAHNYLVFGNAFSGYPELAARAKQLQLEGRARRLVRAAARKEAQK